MVNTKGNQVEFIFYRPQADRVELIGDFNDWRPGELQMKQQEKGYWKAVLRLPAGTYKFRYRADGQWYADYAAFGLEYGPFGPDAILRVA